jgi:hypothetical protein
VIAAAIAAAVVGLPLFGHSVVGRDSYVTQLRRDTLEPVPGAPLMPRRTYGVELSPDRRKIVAASPKQLAFYDRASGSLLGRIAISRPAVNLIWLTSRRLVVTTANRGYSPENHRGSVVVVNPVTLKVVASQGYRGVAESVRAGRRIVVYFRDSPSRLFARVFDADGRMQHRIALPYVGSGATIRGELWIAGTHVLSGGGESCDPDPVHYGIYTLHAHAGTVSFARLPPHDPDDPDHRFCATQFAPGSGAGRTPLLLDGDGDNTAERKVNLLDAGSFEPRAVLPVHSFDPQFPSTPVCSTRHGFVVFGRKVELRDRTGRVRWRIRDSADAPWFPCAVSRGRVYYPRRNGRRWTIRIRRINDGRLVNTVPGRFYFFAPRAGRSIEQVPYMLPPPLDTGD